jgi:hypothetical protein
MRRKSAGHSGPLTKILVANRGVSPSKILVYPASNDGHDRKLLYVFSGQPMSWPCTQSQFTLLKIVYLLIVKRFGLDFVSV